MVEVPWFAQLLRLHWRTVGTLAVSVMSFVVICVQAREMEPGGIGAPGEAAPRLAAQESEAGTGAATMWTPTAKGTSVADPR